MVSLILTNFHKNGLYQDTSTSTIVHKHKDQDAHKSKDDNPSPLINDPECTDGYSLQPSTTHTQTCTPNPYKQTMHILTKPRRIALQTKARQQIREITEGPRSQTSQPQATPRDIYPYSLKLGLLLSSAPDNVITLIRFYLHHRLFQVYFANP